MSSQSYCWLLVLVARIFVNNKQGWSIFCESNLTTLRVSAVILDYVNFVLCCLTFLCVFLVSEMLQIARQCGNRNGGPQILTFGEFCVFLREMQKSKQPRKSQQSTKYNNSECSLHQLLNETFNINLPWFTSKLPCVSECTPNNCEVFLGGSCNPTTWRTDTAIPELKRQGITFYNPVSKAILLNVVCFVMWVWFF